MAGPSAIAGGRRALWSWWTLAVLLGAPLACARDASGDPQQANAAADTGRAAPAPDPLAAVARAVAPQGAYRVIRVTNPGTIEGVVALDRMPVRHDTALTGDEASVCGAAVPDRTVVTAGRRLSEALVWLSDIHAGRDLPADRRANLSIVRCQFVPRMLALVNGTTINLLSKDATVHHTRFFSESEGELLSRMLTVDKWAVVPSARIAADPGFVRVRLSRHPYVRGFVAVFQHPYFAVTDRYGRYVMRGVPAGTYHLRIWHERADRVTERVVTVKAGRATVLADTLTLH
ncbi:MAG TPA: hypothetical protein VFT41_11815 [Gemmatimonadaceae bacterium]|nr:hypothetical protein [Gemmatimonadaceae bacterium]